MAKAGEPEVRARIRRQHRPRWYDWRLHVAAMVGSWAATVGVCLWRIDGAQPLEWLWVLGGVALSYTAEYAFHRWPFHHRWGGGVYRRHTVLHHNFFTDRHVTIDSLDDLWLVLLPPFAFLAFWTILAPMMAGLHFVAGPNAPWLFALGALGVYYPLYEIPHFVSHFAKRGGPLAHPFWHAISLHHRLHHAPDRMQHNLSFGIPLWDRVLGTYWRDRDDGRD
jgi:hypothetical protein